MMDDVLLLGRARSRTRNSWGCLKHRQYEVSLREESPAPRSQGAASARRGTHLRCRCGVDLKGDGQWLRPQDPSVMELAGADVDVLFCRDERFSSFGRLDRSGDVSAEKRDSRFGFRWVRRWPTMTCRGD
jgi:hypothetical protein